MSITIEIRCDGCDVLGDTSLGKNPKAHVVREKLRKEGWAVSQQNGEDYCAECWREKRSIERDQDQYHKYGERY